MEIEAITPVAPKQDGCSPIGLVSVIFAVLSIELRLNLEFTSLN